MHPEATWYSVGYRPRTRRVLYMTAGSRSCWAPDSGRTRFSARLWAGIPSEVVVDILVLCMEAVATAIVGVVQWTRSLAGCPGPLP